MNCCCGMTGQEYLTEHEDGLIKSYKMCSSCHSFMGWVKPEKSKLIQEILKQNFQKYKREAV